MIQISIWYQMLGLQLTVYQSALLRISLCILPYRHYFTSDSTGFRRHCAPYKSTYLLLAFNILVYCQMRKRCWVLFFNVFVKLFLQIVSVIVGCCWEHFFPAPIHVWPIQIYWRFHLLTKTEVTAEINMELFSPELAEAEKTDVTDNRCS